MKNLFLVGLFGLLLSSCAGMPSMKDSCTTLIMNEFGECIEDPEAIKLPAYALLLDLPAADVMPVVAVYGFKDLTGQRKRQDGVATFSTAVSQGATEMLIDALKTAGGGTWFRVVERQGIDNLVRERQIVRSTREQFEEEGKKTTIQPLLFAGIILEGGIIGYDTNMETGGRGARTLGVGHSVAYRRDTIIVSLRAVSTLTGEVLMNVQTKKTVLSVSQGFDVFKFVDMDTQLVEIDDGVTEIESGTFATRAAIEAAVLEMIYQGHDRKYWTIDGKHRHPHNIDGTTERHAIGGNEEDENDE